MGIPVAFYGFFNGPFKRWDQLSLNYEFGLGAAFNWRTFNPISNQYNLSIGAIGLTLRDYDFHVSGFIEWNVGYRIKWR